MQCRNEKKLETPFVIHVSLLVSVNNEASGFVIVTAEVPEERSQPTWYPLSIVLDN